MIRTIFLLLFMSFTYIGITQNDSLNKKERLDFAKMYFEIGGTFLPSFSGSYLNSNEVTSFENPSSAIQYLNWGGFHFWGHGEFYVTFPLAYYPLQEKEKRASEIFHSVVTGFRYYPWVYKEKKLIPYIGGNWSALSFKQKFEPEIDQPTLYKDFIFSLDAGVLFGYKNFALRLGGLYFPNTTWDYPLDKSTKASIKTPNMGLQVGVLYGFDATKDTKEENIIKWNEYESVSKLSFDSKRFGDLFIGAGPSLSFSLKKSDYNLQEFSYLSNRLSSNNYFDISLGYHFNKANWFTSFSFRNPTFETNGFGTEQQIKKTSIAFELNKFLIDYNGFAPYIGINLAYDKITYSEKTENSSKNIQYDGQFEPGITIGWDIVPGKTQEALILRTNLRWFPIASFEVEDINFNLSQLEYNLIQVIFYPQRLNKNK